MSTIDVAAALKEQQGSLRHLLETLQLGRAWMSERPGRATVEEIAQQIEQIKALLDELEKLLTAS